MRTTNEAQAILKADILNITLLNKYKDLNKHVKTLLYKAKREYYENQIIASKNNISRTWKIIKKTLFPLIIKKSNTSVTENIQHIAEDFNNFFAKVGKNTFDNTQWSLQDSQHSPDIESDGNFNCKAPFFRLQPVDVNTVILTIKHLNETISFGSDKFSLRFIRLHVCYCLLPDSYYQHLNFHRSFSYFMETRDSHPSV